MRFEEHCQRCHALLGDRFDQVHIWLDHFAYVPSTLTHEAYYDPMHRQYRHHVQGIIEIRQKWGQPAATAAVVHILDDLFPGGWAEEDAIRIPWNQSEYLRMLGH